MSEFRTGRRILFQGLGALGVAAALAGCGGGGGGSAGEAPPTVEPGAVLATTSEVPVGGGVVLADAQIVLTQPTEGVFRGFTAVCTHQGLLVTGVTGGTIRCDNHGSHYDAGTGEVTAGPASAALAEVAITVEGAQILAA